MRIIIRTLLVLTAFFLEITGLIAQTAPVKKSRADSLYSEFDNTIYNAFYTPSFMGNKVAVCTYLKVDIDKQGKVTNIGFSDSADSSFIKAWVNKKRYHDDKATIENYAKTKGYFDLSLLILVSFEPNSPNPNKQFSYDYLETLMKFNKKDFVGRAVMLPPIFIPVQASGNR